MDLRADLPARPGGLPLHVGDLALRAQVRIGIAMAVEAPLHRERRDGVDAAHRIDAPVAFDAAHAVRDVRRVIEVDEPGELVNPPPADRAVVEPARSYQLEATRFLPYLGMAVHAHRRRRHPRVRRSGRFVVAIEAVDAV